MKHLSYLIPAILLTSCKIKTDSVEDKTDPEPDSQEVIQQFAAPPSSSQEETTPVSELNSEQLRVTERPPQTPKPKKPKYPVAEKAVGRPGYVINPITGGEVDVRGIPPGTLVVDPKDPDHNKFRTPEAP